MISNVLIILGMHRSGTSLVSGWLSKCGLDIGQQVGGPDRANLMGHFEDLEFLSLHQNLLRKHKNDSRGLIPPFNLELDDSDKQEIQKLLTSKIAKDQWAWKEPRTCLFLDYYKLFLSQARYLVIYRNFHFVVDSLIKREMIMLRKSFNKLSLIEKKEQAGLFEDKLKEILQLANTYLLTWIIYNERILAFLKSNTLDSFIVIQYSDLLKNDRQVFQKIRRWGFNLSFYSFNDIYDSDLINKELPKMTFDSKLLAQAISIEREFEKMRFGTY